MKLAAKWPLKFLILFQFLLLSFFWLFSILPSASTSLLLVLQSPLMLKQLENQRFLTWPLRNPLCLPWDTQSQIFPSSTLIIHALLNPFCSLRGPRSGNCVPNIRPTLGLLLYPDDEFSIIVSNVRKDRLGYITSHSRSYIRSNRRQNLTI
jgi:hypothetical protein